MPRGYQTIVPDGYEKRTIDLFQGVQGSNPTDVFISPDMKSALDELKVAGHDELKQGAARIRYVAAIWDANPEIDKHNEDNRIILKQLTQQLLNEKGMHGNQADMLLGTHEKPVKWSDRFKQPSVPAGSPKWDR